MRNYQVHWQNEQHDISFELKRQKKEAKRHVVEVKGRMYEVIGDYHNYDKIKELFKTYSKTIDASNLKKSLNKIEGVSCRVKGRSYWMVPIALRSLSYSFFRYLNERVYSAIRWIMGTKRLDSHKLVKSRKQISVAHEPWYLNLALMKQSRDRTKDPEVKSKLTFLINNYLSKSAPIYMDEIRSLYSDTEAITLSTPSTPFPYHRYGFLHNLKIGEAVNKKLPDPKNSPFIPTDSIDIVPLLKLQFHYMGKNSTQWRSAIYNAFQQGVEKTIPKTQMAKELILDLSDVMSKDIYGDKKAFNKELNEVKQTLNKQIELEAENLQGVHVGLDVKDIVAYIKKNMTLIYRVPSKDGKPEGIKVFPFYASLRGKQILKRHTALMGFLTQTGIFTGAISMRRALMDLSVQHTDVEYGVKTSKANPTYFETRDDFLKSLNFTGFVNAHEKSDKPHLKNQGLALANLVEGLLKNEVSDVAWSSLNSGETKEIVQTSLFRLHIHLMNARTLMDHDYVKYMDAIELAHYELTTLLEFARPFKQDDFGEIFQNNLTCVPDGLKPKAILCKTGINTFAGVNAAIAKSGAQPVRVYGKEFYFEQVKFVGIDKSLEAVLKDESIKKIDLFACQFNPNIEIESDFKNYEVGKIGDDIDRILKAKPDTEHMSVVIDCTIDYINSQKIEALLGRFKDQIDAGRLNFVMFRSGQKFDMFGLDNYYGAPVFMVNNGNKHWQNFNQTLEGDAYRTDELSNQWFCLANKYASKELDGYRKLIFDNARRLLQSVPQKLQGDHTVRVNTADDDVDACYIDIKITGSFHKLRAYSYIGIYYQKCIKQGIRPQTRASIGFAHSNAVVIAINEVAGSTTMRICPGINPEENQVILDFLSEL